MAWPTPEDYNEAVQNPLNFRDPDLRSGILELSPFTGKFASVYRTTSGSDRWAVRCFLRDFPDYEQRYAAIGGHLTATNLPYTVGFQFIEKGIRVRGRLRPILKMEWIEALSLRDYIEQNIGNPLVFATLAERWVTLLRRLKKHSIAHGDLQHGNVLISNGDFRLIDYDGMFVPALAGMKSHEVGHSNYQHPGRTENDFGAHIDNFSGWLIYLTLIALSIEPGLWSRFGKGEDHLLFCKEDLDEPRLSRLFQSLDQIKDDRIQKYVPLFRSFLEMGLPAIASPADVIGVRPRKKEGNRTLKAAWTPEVQLDLFALKPAPMLPQQLAEDILVAQQATMEPDVVHFNRSYVRERVLLGFYGAFIFTLLTLTARGTVSLSVGLVILLCGLGCIAASLTCSYMSLGEVRGKLQVWFRLEFRRTADVLIRKTLVRAHVFLAWLDSTQTAHAGRVAARLAECTRTEKKRTAEVRSTLSAFLDELTAQQAALDKAELDETSAVLATMQSRYNVLLQEGAFLVDIPAEHLVRPGLKRLLNWREAVKELRRMGPPLILPAYEQARIERKFEIERETVRESDSFAQEESRRKIESIRASAKRYRERIDSRFDQRRVWLERLKQLLKRHIESANSWLDANQDELKACVAEMKRYREIRLSRYLPRLFGFLP